MAGKLLHNGLFDTKHLMIHQNHVIKKEELLKNSKTVFELPFAKMVVYGGKTFFIPTPPFKKPPHGKRFFASPPPPPPPPPNRISMDVVLEDVQQKTMIWIWAVPIFIDFLMLFFFFYLMRKLLPLHRLKNALMLYKEGDIRLNLPTDAKDEISEITVEFNKVLEKIASVKEARVLFMRNVFHELKTPIMKGLLISDSLEADSNQKRLKIIFERMTYLLDEFSKVERFGSGEWKLNRQKYRFADLFESALDILMCNKKNFIIKESEDFALEVDFELFSIALKNLLDNAIKYGDSMVSIEVNADSIKIINSGNKIQNIDFSKPFNRLYENSNAGLGLGLYLTNSIIQKHGFDFFYEYKNGLNFFKIEL